MAALSGEKPVPDAVFIVKFVGLVNPVQSNM